MYVSIIPTVRDEIINLAVDQLKAGGYKALNFAVIAEQLDTTRANLHHHFKNKEGLGIEATKAYRSGNFARYAAMGDYIVNIYRRSGDVDRNFSRAVDRVNELAELGDADAQRWFGWMLAYGMYGKKEDAAAGLEWLKRAAEQGDSRAMVRIGLIYEKGRGVSAEPGRRSLTCSGAWCCPDWLIAILTLA